MNKLTLRIVLLFVLTLCYEPVSADEYVEEDDIYYWVNPETGTANANIKSDAHGEVTIPATVEYEGNTYYVKSVGNTRHYTYCENLIGVIICEGIEVLESDAIRGSNITYVVLPSTITKICEFDCNPFDIYCFAETVPRLQESFYSSYLNNCTLHVPSGCTAAYAAAENWNSFNDIVEITDDFTMFPDCTNNEERFAAVYLNRLGIVEGSDGQLLANEDVTRAAVAKTTFFGVYKGASNVPEEIVTDKFPCVYDDLQNPETYYERAAKALLYLEYGNGVTPFDRDRLNFDPDGTIQRIHVLKVLIEAFNLNEYGWDYDDNPFPNDPDVVSLAASNPRMLKYINQAANNGYITTANERFRPFDNCTRGEAFMMLCRIMKSDGKYKELPRDRDYFCPLNVTTANISQGLSLIHGNFQHYTKTSFAIPGTVPLTFAHTYNSYNTTLPSVFYGAKKKNLTDVTYQPMGDGWSHNYHSFITVVGKFDSSAPSYGLRAIVHWGGGRMDVYRSNGSKLVPESNGVYDDFSREGGDVIITTKQQVKYRFSKVDADDAVAVLYLVSIVDRNGNTLTIDYEDGVNGGQRITTVHGEGRSLTFTYLDGTDLLSEVTDPLGRKVTFAYTENPFSSKLQLTSFTDAEGNTTTYEYEAGADMYNSDPNVMSSKLLTRIQLPKGNYIQNYYGNNYRLTETENGINGVPTSKTSICIYTSFAPNMNSNNTYNESWLGDSYMESTVIVDRGGTSSSYLYVINENNVPTRIHKPDDDDAFITYDDYSHPELPTTIRQSTNGRYVSFQYDAKGNVTGYQNKYGGKWAEMTYDTMNNLKTYKDFNGNVTTYNYDENGNLVGIQAPEDVRVGIAVNEKGLPTEVTNPMGVKTTYEYNDYGNLVKTSVPVLGLTTSAVYDAASRLTSATNALERINKYTYDKNDHLLTTTDPMNHITSFGYDANGNLETITNAKNGVTTLTYDNATDWLTSVSFGESTKQYTYNNDGTVNTFTKPDGTTLNYTYDQLGRVTNDGVNQYSYTGDNLLEEVSGGGKSISFYYDDADRVSGVKYDNDWNTSLSFEYDDNGNCINMSGIEFSYDALNRLTKVYEWIDNTSVEIKYTYRKDSQLEKVEYTMGYGVGPLTTEYGYDAVGRLTSKTTKLTTNYGSELTLAAYQVELDKAGNIVQQTTQEPYNDIVLANEDVSFSYNDGNRITEAGDISFEFDKNGNTTKRGNEEYSWDAKDRLTSNGSTNITYDPLGLIASYGDITFRTNPLGMGNVTYDSKSGAEYIYGHGLEARVVNGKVSYYVTDLRGSVVAIVDEYGNITHKYQYDEFGKVVQKEEADYNPFQYVGKYGVMCLNDHLYYMRARHYDPTIGRFLSEDPIWSTNLYPYADNNPIMGIDPRGTDCTFYSTSVSLATGKSEGYWKCDNSVFTGTLDKSPKLTTTSTSGMNKEEIDWHKTEQYKSAYAYIMSKNSYYTDYEETINPPTVRYYGAEPTYNNNENSNSYDWITHGTTTSIADNPAMYYFEDGWNNYGRQLLVENPKQILYDATIGWYNNDD